MFQILCGVGNDYSRNFFCWNSHLIITVRFISFLAIVTTTGFLDYLYEMLWSVVSLKVENLSDPDNSTKLAHCNSALRILHLCSIDKNSLVDMLNSKLLRVLQCLLLSLNRAIQANSSKNVFTFSRQNSTKSGGPSGLDRENKQQGLLDRKEEIHEEEKTITNGADEDVLSSSGYFRESLQFDGVTASNDNIFYEEDELDNGAPKTVHFVDVADQEESLQRPPRRMRADSYIVRADTRNRQRSESRNNMSLLEQSVTQSEAAADEEQSVSTTPAPTPTPSRAIPLKSDTANHQQLRRISRSMSISMQLSKTINEEDKTSLPNIDGILMQLTKHAIMIIYHVLSRSDEATWSKILSLHYIPILVNTLGLFDDQFKEEIGLPISASLISCQSFLQNSSQGKI